MKYYKKTVALLCALALGSSVLVPAMAEAKKPKPSKVKPVETSEVTTTKTTTTTTTSTSQTTTFTTSQTTQIVEIIRGTSSSSYLITDSLRDQIYAQQASLPPGIRKNLLRGKSLPPGIAKKVKLPLEVCNYVNLPTNTNIIVVGSNIVLVNSVTNVVLDIVFNIL